jgi:hypothetical protein
MRKEPHICDNCEEDFDELFTREGFVQTYYVDFVCKGCFQELEGVSFEEYREVGGA